MKIIKKIIVTTLLSLSLAVTFIPIDVFAINTVDKWDGTVDTSWYDNHEMIVNIILQQQNSLQELQN